jgi:hypothetical protein
MLCDEGYVIPHNLDILIACALDPDGEGTGVGLMQSMGYRLPLLQFTVLSP